MPFVDSDTHDQRLRALPNPTAWIWDEIHPAGRPPNWDHHLYWPWENVRVLLTFVPSRMRSVPDRAVVLLYKPMPQPPPLVNPLGLRPQSLQRLMGYCCGSARANSCPIGECSSFPQCLSFIFDNSGERLVGACSHCATALSLAAVIPGNPGQFPTTHRGVRLLDRKNPEQMDISTAAEVS